MSDLELEMIRYRKMLELKRQIEERKMKSEKPKEVNPREVLDKFFVDRAWEVFNAAKYQYPEVADYVEKILVKLILEGKIRDKISGEDLYGLFLRLGYRVRLQTRINIIEDGKVKSLEQKIREEISDQ
ncbi:MAG: DNA-binding protein [Candidatus Bathyarchaeia archaeon]